MFLYVCTVQLISNFIHASELHVCLKATALEIYVQCMDVDHHKQCVNCNTRVYSDIKQFKHGRLKKQYKPFLPIFSQSLCHHSPDMR